MVEINGNYLCEGCFEKIDGENTCKCGMVKNPSDSLNSGTILNGRYIVGKQIRETKTVKEYLCYDSQKDNVVLVKEFFPKVFVFRSDETSIVLKSKNNLDAYNASMQKFIKMMQIPQSLSGSDCFIRVQNAFYENNTAYFIVEKHSLITVKEYINNNRKVSDKRIVRSLYTAVKGLCELERMGFVNGNISAGNVYIDADGIKIDGFEPNEDDFAPYMKESMVFNRTSFYMSASDFAKRGKDIFSDVFSVGAVLYTMLTSKTPESPFECKSQFDKSAIENSTNEKMLVEIVKKMCRIDSPKYESLNSLVSDVNKLLKRYGLKEVKTDNQYPKTTKGTSERKTLKIVVAVIMVIAIIVAAVIFVFVRKNAGVQDTQTGTTSLATETVSEISVTETE